MTTTRRRLLFFSVLVPSLSRFSSGQNSQTPSDTASVFSKHMDWMEQQFVPVAEAMPEDKFFWAPTSGEFHGVRNFAEQLIHVAEVNFALSAAILGESSAKGSSAEAIKTRSAVLQYLKDSFYLHSPSVFIHYRAKCEAASQAPPLRHDYYPDGPRYRSDRTSV